MPVYDFQCKKCQKIEEYIRSISDNSEVKCSKCNTPMTRLFTLNTTGFIIKGGSPTIHYREKRLRMKKREKITKKQKERYNESPQVKPNIAGVETGTWADAQKMAKEAGLNHESYTPFVEKEKKKKIIV